jgi:hypothetical protein
MFTSNKNKNIVEMVAANLPGLYRMLKLVNADDVNITRLSLFLKYTHICGAVVVKSNGKVLSYRLCTIDEDVMETISVVEDVYKFQNTDISEAAILYIIDSEDGTLDAHYFHI